MASPSLGYLDYLKAAFNARAQVKGLGGVPVNWLGIVGFAALGFVNPGFWLIGAAAELGYLVTMSHNGRFRKFVDAMAASATRGDVRAKWEALEERLDDADKARLGSLLERCDRAKSLSEKLGVASAAVGTGSLTSLQVIYARLLVSRSVLEAQLAEMDQATLEAQLAEAEDKLAHAPADDTRLQQTLESTVDILHKRLANHGQATSNLTFIEAELGRIEQQVELIVEEAALAKDAAHLSSYIDSVVQTFGETKSWMQANLTMADADLALADEAAILTEEEP